MEACRLRRWSPLGVRDGFMGFSFEEHLVVRGWGSGANKERCEKLRRDSRTHEPATRVASL